MSGFIEIEAYLETNISNYNTILSKYKFFFESIKYNSICDVINNYRINFDYKNNDIFGNFVEDDLTFEYIVSEDKWFNFIELNFPNMPNFATLIMPSDFNTKNESFWLTLSLSFMEKDLIDKKDESYYGIGVGKYIFYIMKKYFDILGINGVYFNNESQSREPMEGIINKNLNIYESDFMLIPKDLLYKLPTQIRNNIPDFFSIKEFKNFIALADMRVWKIEPWLEN